MSEATAATKVYGKPGSGWTDGGDVWRNSKSAYGMRYACKRCGKRGSGYGDREVDHFNDCAVTAAHRERRAAEAKERADKANEARVFLSGIDWSTVSDDLALRLMAEVSK